MSSCYQPVLFRTIYYSKENFYMVSLQTVFTYPFNRAKIYAFLYQSSNIMVIINDVSTKTHLRLIPPSWCLILVIVNVQNIILFSCCL